MSRLDCTDWSQSTREWTRRGRLATLLEVGSAAENQRRAFCSFISLAAIPRRSYLSGPKCWPLLHATEKVKPTVARAPTR